MILEIVVGILIAYYTATLIVPFIWDVLVTIKEWLEEHGEMIVGAVILLIIIAVIVVGITE